MYLKIKPLELGKCWACKDQILREKEDLAADEHTHTHYEYTQHEGLKNKRVKYAQTRAHTHTHSMYLPTYPAAYMHTCIQIYIHPFICPSIHTLYIAHMYRNYIYIHMYL